MLTSHSACSLNFCVQFSCLQCGRSKRKASEMTERRLFWSIPLGLDLTGKEEKLSPFSHTQTNNRFPTKWTILIPHLSTCEQSVLEPPPVPLAASPPPIPLAARSPPNSSLHNLASLPLVQSLQQAPLNHPKYHFLCQLNSPRYSVTTAAASFHVDPVIV